MIDSDFDSGGGGPIGVESCRWIRRTARSPSAADLTFYEGFLQEQSVDPVDAAVSPLLALAGPRIKGSTGHGEEAQAALSDDTALVGWIDTPNRHAARRTAPGSPR